MAIHRFSLQHNDSYAFHQYPELTNHQRVHQQLVPDFTGATITGARRCPKCGHLLNKWDDPLSALVVKKKKYDIGLTYDGITVVSEKFKATYERAKLTGLVFRQLPRDQSFFAVRATKAVPFDAKRRKTEFIDRCSECGNFESVVGATPVLLQPGSAVAATELVRTDLEFGSDDEKSPLLLCGETAANELSAAKLRGVDLFAI
jgi:hypothetical protein